jgi:predicted ATPase
VHTGTPLVTAEGYVGADLHRAARIAAAGHGGQVLVSASTATLVDASLRDLGEHRLKDLSAPVRLYQLGEDEFPPLTSLYRTNLPVPATAFLGREAELREVGSLLSQEEVRLVTLTGPGGTGKTRLALQAAAELADDYPDGVWWVPLAALRDASLVRLSIAEALQLRDEPGLGIGDRLSAGLTGRRPLLLLDNAEHLLPAIADTVVELLAIEGPLILVTSRERLQVQGEHLYPVPAMDASDGVDLFVAGARRLDLAFTTTPGVGELCERLEWLPLALELASARTVLYTPEQLLERLSDRLDLLKAGRDSDPRQQTLRATIDWSYALLTPEEQRVYRALSVFAGGCILETAERVCETTPDTLASLLDKSLLRRRDASSSPRYSMLETIREHAGEHLADRGERDSVEAAQARAYLDLAERAWQQLTTLGADDAAWFKQLSDERDNIRVALAHYRDHGDARGFARLCVAYWFVWFLDGDVREGRRWLEVAYEQGPPEELRSAIENAFAALIIRSASSELDRALALAIARSAVDHAQLRRDRLAEAMALITVADILIEADPDVAREARRSARRLAIAAGDAFWQMTATYTLAEQALYTRDWASALTELEACKALTEKHGHGSLLFPLSTITAEVEWQVGNVDAARQHLYHALSAMQSNPVQAAYNEISLAAEIAAHDGDLNRAAALSSASTILLADLGMREDDWDIERSARIEALAREPLGEEAWAAACERGRSLTLDEALLVALESTHPAER